MQRQVVLGFLFVVPLVLAPSASRATSLAFQGTLTIELLHYGTYTFSGSGTGDSGGAGGPASIPAGSFVLDTVQMVGPFYLTDLGGICAGGIPLLTPMTPPSCAPNAGGTLGAVSFDGTSGTGAPIASLYLGTTNTGNSFLEQPLSVLGVGGTVAGTTPTPATLSLTGNSWQLGTVTVDGVTSGGNPISNSATGFDARDANGVGTLQLVTGAYFDIVAGTGETVPIVATLQLEFVPEPSTVILLGTGVAALALRGRRARS